MLKVTLDANALLTLSVYARQIQQSAQLFRPCVSGEFDIGHPWLETQHHCLS